MRAVIAIALGLGGCAPRGSRPLEGGPAPMATAWREGVFLAGPYADLPAYCREVPGHAFEPPDSAQPSYGCASADAAPEAHCPSIALAPRRGPVRAVALVPIATDDRTRCVLGLRTARGWFFDEEALRMDNERHYHQLLELGGDTPDAGGGVIAHARVRWINTTRDQDANPFQHCYDDLRLYGVGPSGRVSRVAVSVAELQACDVEPLPPFARWDQAIDATLVGADELQLTRVAGTSTLVGTHTLRFP